ncbi:Conserved hypothetical membrane protein [Candidatus Protochlamydia naegleriophila]|uniref:Conserved hypothetical membrane protein n=1 Tax=Candidatus Protochlamydia naegleriophila TaxID=389348 RepID=A0A0U5JG95_9BACT|nr:hypothetical protein [Candidatus Protochlamydia naegleriophila]CUI17634.1 Conserved hypothetical membrane protein [Candidatus Protochlamydia naegleriophila]
MFALSLDSLQWLGLGLGLIATLCMIYKSTCYFIQIIRGKKYHIRPLFRDFKEKMWMTVGLGCLFFGLYLFLVLSGSVLINSEMGSNLFTLSYKNPIEFIYLGLFIFATLSLSIYLVRMMIKYLYITRSKGS